MYTLYILRCLKNNLYIGVTSNLQARIERHKKGEGAEFTKRNKPIAVVYTEQYLTLIEARRREEQLKKWSRKKKENLIHSPIKIISHP